MFHQLCLWWNRYSASSRSERLLCVEEWKLLHNKLSVCCVHRYVRANLHNLLRFLLLQSMDFVNQFIMLKREDNWTLILLLMYWDFQIPVLFSLE